MKKMRRLLSAFLALVMAFFALPGGMALARGCSHINAYYAPGDSWIEPYSDKEHLSRWTELRVCADCGAVVARQEFKMPIAHNFPFDYDTGAFDYSRCTVCGYRNKVACTHPRRSTEKISAPYFDYNDGYNVSSSSHVLTRDLNVYCDDCGELVDSEIYDEWTESHSYNDNGKCKVCGYAIPKEQCDHSPRRSLLSSHMTADSASTHKITEKYRVFCLCGKIDRTEEASRTANCSFTLNTVILPEHKEAGHPFRGGCACGNTSDSAGYAPYLEGCQTCLEIYGPDPVMKKSGYSERAKELQEKLAELGYLNSACDGLFGQKTHDALIAFQHDYNLPETGILSPDTEDILDEALLDRPIKQSSVYSERAKELQEKLAELGYLNSACDGLFGKKTTEAVKNFQRDHNLPETGVVDSATMDAIDAALNPAPSTPVPTATGTPEPTITGTPEPTVTPEPIIDDALVLISFDEGYDPASDTLYLPQNGEAFIALYNVQTGDQPDGSLWSAQKSENGPELTRGMLVAVNEGPGSTGFYVLAESGDQAWLEMFSGGFALNSETLNGMTEDEFDAMIADRFAGYWISGSEGAAWAADASVIDTMNFVIGPKESTSRYLLSAESAGYSAAEDTLYIEEYESVGLIVIDIQTGEHLSLKDIPGAKLRVLPGGSVTGLRYTAGDCGEARIFLECDGVLQDIMTVWVMNFRQFVHNLAKLYDEYHKASEHYNYYYEASDLKHEFDDQFFNHDLDYNTHADSRTDYEQQARELYLYTLSQNIQEKKTEMLAMTEAERAAYFPGVMYDPAQGAWKVGDLADNAQALVDEDLAAAIDQEIVNMFELALNASMETCLFFSGSEDSTPQIITELVTKTVETAWSSWCEIEHNEAKKYMKNAYRKAMIQEVMAAQRNLDEQMYRGLKEIKSNINSQAELTQDDLILRKVIDELLAVVEPGTSREKLLNTSLSTAAGDTLEDAIEQAAEDLVSSMNMPEEIPLTWQERNEKVLMDVIKMAMKRALSHTLKKQNPVIIASIGGDMAIDTAINDLFDSLSAQNIPIDTDESGTITKDEMIQWFVKKLVNDKTIKDALEKIFGSYIRIDVTDLGPISIKTDMLDNEVQKALTAYDNTQAMYELSAALDPYSTDTFNYALEVDRAAREVEFWENLKKDAGFIGALVGNSYDLAKSTLKMALQADDLKNSFESETLYSYMANAMYRTRQQAEKARKTAAPDALRFLDYENVQAASLDELKVFADNVYTVFNSDLLGHAYYTTLAAAYAYETDYIERLKEHTAEAQSIVEGIESHWEDNLFMRGIYERFEPSVKALWYGSAIAMTHSVSNYLKMVEDDSKIGSWLDEDTCKSVYDGIGEYVDQAEMPEVFDRLFQ